MERASLNFSHLILFDPQIAVLDTVVLSVGLKTYKNQPSHIYLLWLSRQCG